MHRILLVEDDPTIVTNLVDILKREGFSVDTASGQRIALERMEKEKYDLCLLDISLKEGNGFAVCRAIKEKEDTPVIFLHGFRGRIQRCGGL